MFLQRGLERLWCCSRPNSRNFTTVSNSGVTRSEKLTPWLGLRSHTAREEELRSEVGVAREIDRMSCEDMSGLEECFRRVCKVGEDECVVKSLHCHRSFPFFFYFLLLLTLFVFFSVFNVVVFLLLLHLSCISCLLPTSPLLSEYKKKNAADVSPTVVLYYYD